MNAKNTRICIVNIKGGVGKTTTAVNMSVLLANLEYRVLLIDLDPQGNATKQFQKYALDKLSITDVLVDPKQAVSEVIIASGVNNLDILPSNLNLAAANRTIAINTMIAQQNILSKKMREVDENYDYVIIDCGPNLDLLTINGLVYCNQVITPIKIDQYAVDGLNHLISQVHEVKENFNPDIEFLGCLITMYRKVKLDDTILNNFSKELRLFKTVIRDTVKVREATFEKPAVLYDAKATASIDYNTFVAELLARGN